MASQKRLEKLVTFGHCEFRLWSAQHRHPRFSGGRATIGRKGFQAARHCSFYVFLLLSMIQGKKQILGNTPALREARRAPRAGGASLEMLPRKEEAAANNSPIFAALSCFYYQGRSNCKPSSWLAYAMQENRLHPGNQAVNIICPVSDHHFVCFYYKISAVEQFLSDTGSDFQCPAAAEDVQLMCWLLNWPAGLCRRQLSLQASAKDSSLWTQGSSIPARTAANNLTITWLIPRARNKIITKSEMLASV